MPYRMLLGLVVLVVLISNSIYMLFWPRKWFRMVYCLLYRILNKGMRLPVNWQPKHIRFYMGMESEPTYWNRVNEWGARIAGFLYFLVALLLLFAVVFDSFYTA